MSAGARDYIASTIAGLVPATMPQHRYADIDAGRGRQVPTLEEAAGRTRAFELTVGDAAPVPLAGPTITAMDADMEACIRHDASGPHDRHALIDTMHSDLIAIAQGLRSGAWSSVSGLAVLVAEPGEIIEVSNGGGRMVALIGSVNIRISYDV